MSLRYGTRTLLLAMIATVIGVIVYRLVISSITNPLEHLTAIAAGVVIALGTYLITRSTNNIAARVFLIVVVFLVGIWFSEIFPSYVLGLMVGLLLPITTVPTLNFLYRISGIEMRSMKERKGRSND